MAGNPTLESEGRVEGKTGKLQGMIGRKLNRAENNERHPCVKEGDLGKALKMFWIIFIILLVLWGLGLLTGTTMGGVIHALLVIAIIVMLIQVLRGRRRV